MIGSVVPRFTKGKFTARHVHKNEALGGPFSIMLSTAPFDLSVNGKRTTRANMAGNMARNMASTIAVDFEALGLAANETVTSCHLALCCYGGPTHGSFDICWITKSSTAAHKALLAVRLFLIRIPTCVILLLRCSRMLFWLTAFRPYLPRFSESSHLGRIGAPVLDFCSPTLDHTTEEQFFPQRNTTTLFVFNSNTVLDLN